MIKGYEIYLGLNDKEAKKQLVDTTNTIAEVAEITEKFGCATIKLGDGIYRHDDGTLVIEKTIIIEMLDIEKSLVIELANILKDRYNQESILLKTVNCDMEFIR